MEGGHRHHTPRGPAGRTFSLQRWVRNQVVPCDDVRSAGLFHTTKHKPIWDFASLAERHLRGEVLSISGAPVRHKAAWRKTGGHTCFPPGRHSQGSGCRTAALGSWGRREDAAGGQGGARDSGLMPPSLRTCCPRHLSPGHRCGSPGGRQASQTG